MASAGARCLSGIAQLAAAASAVRIFDGLRDHSPVTIRHHDGTYVPDIRFRFQMVSLGVVPGYGSSALTGADATFVKASCR